MSWRYLKIIYGRLGSTETNPYEINILAGATKCQVGGSISSTRAPMYSTLATLIDGNNTTATYWGAGTAPTVTVTMPVGHTDLTRIEMWDKAIHTRHTLHLSQDNVEWTECPWIDNTNAGKQQNFSIPALPQTSQNFTADASLNITQFTHGAAQTYTYNEEGGQIVGTPVNWISGANVSISNGTLTKISGGSAYNAGAKGDINYNENDEVFFQVVIDSPKNVIFGFNETGEPDTDNDQIIYFFELMSNGNYIIWTLGEQAKTGTYSSGNTFKVAIEAQQLKFYINNVLVHTNTVMILWPIYIDGAIYNQGDSFTASLNGGLEIVTPQDFEQTGSLNIDFTETAEKIYTAIGYSFDQWSLSFLDFYFFTDQVYTANGYEFEQVFSEPLTLTETAAQDYTANGYNFVGADEENFFLDFAATQDYTPQGLSFEQSKQENIYVSYIGAQSFTAEGYDVASMAQENILLVFIGAQAYTPQGLSFEATGEELFLLSDAATQDFDIHFEQSTQEIINLSMEATQDFAAHFESTASLNFSLSDAAAQDLTPVGYSTETTATETINLMETGTQDFAAHFENSGIDQIILIIAAIQEFQANFTSQGTQTIFIEDLAAATVIYSDGLQFQQNTQEIINLSQVASQVFTPFVGYEFFQNASNDFSLSDAAASLFILGETGVYNQWSTTIIYVQESTEATYTRNWLDFEHVATENINGFTVEAVSDYQNINIFEAQAVESFTWYISPLSWYGRYFPETAQDNFSLLINAASEYTENHLTFDMQANVFFFLHYTDIALHQVNYLTIQQNMYYDFYFWDYADSVYTQNSLTFETQITENIDLSFQTVTQYINANMLNGFATENIGLFTEAAAEYVQTIINHFDHFVVESFNFVFSAISEHVGVDIYVFDGLASEIIGLAFNGTTEHIEAHLFDGLATLNIDLSDQVLSEYKHINVFTSQVFETIDFEGFGTLFVTTEPRQYSVNAYMNFSLKVVNWIYFESDIYVQTYKIEITKINTIWEPTEQDRPLVEENKRPIHEMDISDTIFSAQYKVDRQILNLTKLKGPSKITFEAESQKPNSLYTINHDNDERGLFND